jgi:Helix-turn-helix domain
MSREMRDAVWKGCREQSAKKLVMLALAEFSKPDGSDCFPSVQTLARMTNLSRRQIIRISDELVISGALVVEKNAGPHGTNRYWIAVDVLEPVTRASPPKRARPVTPTSPQWGVTDVTPISDTAVTHAGLLPVTPRALSSDTHVTSTGDIAMSPEPVLNRHEPLVNTPAQARALWPKRMNAKRAKSTEKTALPEYFSVSLAVSKWNDAKGYPPAHLAQHLEFFVGYALANGKRYADWDQAFKNAIRDDWSKVRANAGMLGGFISSGAYAEMKRMLDGPDTIDMSADES